MRRKKKREEKKPVLDRKRVALKKKSVSRMQFRSSSIDTSFDFIVDHPRSSISNYTIQFCFDPTKSIRFQVCFRSDFRRLISLIANLLLVIDPSAKKHLPWERGKMIMLVSSLPRREAKKREEKSACG